jgi:hypothetical protein
MPKQRFEPPNPLEQTARSGIIGPQPGQPVSPSAGETSTPLEGQPASTLEGQPFDLPTGQPASTPDVILSGPPPVQPVHTQAAQTSSSPDFQPTVKEAIEQAISGIAQTSRLPERQGASPSAGQHSGLLTRQRSKQRKEPKRGTDGWEQQTVYLPPDLRQWLRHFALDTNQEMSEVVAMALQEYRIRQRI